jgi:hypothetical protein
MSSTDNGDQSSKPPVDRAVEEIAQAAGDVTAYGRTAVRNPAPLIALYLGLAAAVLSISPLFFIAFFLGIAAAVIGFRGLSRAKQDERHRGVAPARVGIVSGLAGVTLSIIAAVLAVTLLRGWFGLLLGLREEVQTQQGAVRSQQAGFARAQIDQVLKNIAAAASEVAAARMDSTPPAGEPCPPNSSPEFCSQFQENQRQFGQAQTQNDLTFALGKAKDFYYTPSAETLRRISPAALPQNVGAAVAAELDEAMPILDKAVTCRQGASAECRSEIEEAVAAMRSVNVAARRLFSFSSLGPEGAEGLFPADF